MDKKELQQMDRKTRIFITIYGGLRPRSCIGKLYIPLSGGGRGLVSVEDYVRRINAIYRSMQHRVRRL